MIGRALRTGVWSAVVVASTTACFATRGDVVKLQQGLDRDFALVQQRVARADSAQQAQHRQLLSAVRGIADTLTLLGTKVQRLQGDLSTSSYALGQQLITIQELTGQSQRRIQELKAQLEQTAQSTPVALPPANGAAAPSAPSTATGGPGPNQLFQLAQDQLRRGSAGTARAGFEELLRQFPAHELAAEAQFGIAESFAADGGSAAADSAYAVVVDRYPTAPKAPTALYKRAMAARIAGRTKDARFLFQQVVAKYPRSDEALLAADILERLK